MPLRPLVHNPRSQHALDGRTMAWDYLADLTEGRRSADEIAADLTRELYISVGELPQIEWNSYACAALTELLSAVSIKPSRKE